MRETSEFFRKTKKELREVMPCGYTKEECLLFDCGENIHILNDAEDIAEYVKYFATQGKPNYQVLKMTNDKIAIFAI